MGNPLLLSWLTGLEINPMYLVIGVIALVLIFVLKTIKKIVKIMLALVAAFAIYSFLFGNPFF
ncbi:MAG: hypothetical protein IKL87_04635 [Oscillospiraceae bacterium]|jgi:hypothetical protein|nr:hypothetical protein [Oscillospiraceae bacterium]